MNYINFQKYSISVTVREEDVYFQFTDGHGCPHETKQFSLEKFTAQDWAEYIESENRPNFLKDYIETQLTTLNPYGLAVTEDKNIGLTVIIGSYGLPGGGRISQTAQLFSSALQFVGGIGIGFINPWVGNGFISAALASAIRAWHDNCTFSDYLQASGLGFVAGASSAGMSSLVGGIEGVMLGGGISNAVSTSLESLIKEKRMPPAKKILKDFFVGGISSSVRNITQNASRAQLQALIKSYELTSDPVAMEGLSAFFAGPVSETAANLTENALNQRPLNENITPARLAANAFVSGFIASLQTYIYLQQQGKIVKILLAAKDGSEERILWSGSEDDFHKYNIAEKIKELQQIPGIDVDELIFRLAELSEQDTSGLKRKSDVPVHIPRPEWDELNTAAAIVLYAENKSQNNIGLKAIYLMQVMAYKLWGAEENHDEAAKAAMLFKFYQDQNSRHRNKHYNYLIHSVSSYLALSQAKEVVPPLIAHYEAKLEVNADVVRYLSMIPQEDLIVQVYIEQIDQNLQKQNCMPLSKLDKVNLSVSLHNSLTKEITSKQDNHFIQQAFGAISRYFHADKFSIEAIEDMLNKALTTAMAIGQHEFINLQPKKLARISRRLTRFGLHLKDAIVKMIRDVAHNGIEVRVQTDGQDIKASLGAPGQAHALPIYDSAAKNTFTNDFAKTLNNRPTPEKINFDQVSIQKSAPFFQPSPVITKLPVWHDKISTKISPPIKNNSQTMQVNSIKKRTIDSASSEMDVKTQKRQRTKNSKGQVQWRDKTGKFTKALTKEFPVSKLPAVHAGVNITQNELTVGKINNIDYVKPKQLSPNTYLGLTQSTSVSASKSLEKGKPYVAVAADSHLALVNSDKMEIDLLPATLGASASERGFNLNAQASVARARTTVKLPKRCSKESCTQTSVNIAVTGLSVGVKAGFSHQSNKSGNKVTTISGGAGVGPLGFFVEVNMDTRGEKKDTVRITPGLKPK